MKTVAVVLLTLGAIILGVILDLIAPTRPAHWFLLVWLAASALGKIHIVLDGDTRNMGTVLSMLFGVCLVAAAISYTLTTQTPGPPAHESVLYWSNFLVWVSWFAYDLNAVIENK